MLSRELHLYRARVSEAAQRPDDAWQHWMNIAKYKEQLSAEERGFLSSVIHAVVRVRCWA